MEAGRAPAPAWAMFMGAPGKRQWEPLRCISLPVGDSSGPWQPGSGVAGLPDAPCCAFRDVHQWVKPATGRAGTFGAPSVSLSVPGGADARGAEGSFLGWAAWLC